MDIVALVLRWMHIFSAIILFGGILFMRFALMPAAGVLSETDRNHLREGIRTQWAKWIHISAALLLVSGIINFYLKMTTYELKGTGYHAIWGVKVLLALAVMGLATMYLGRSERAQRMREKPSTWLNLMAGLAAVVVMISGYLRLMDLEKLDQVPETSASISAPADVLAEAARYEVMP